MIRTKLPAVLERGRSVDPLNLKKGLTRLRTLLAELVPLAGPEHYGQILDAIDILDAMLLAMEG